jgi:CelD/BcsL family acetyltransferase involved in cellulose biosynthesis
VPAASRAERIDPAGLDEPQLVAAWRGLAVLCANPFLTPEWFRTTLEASSEETPFVLGWWVGEELRGVLPLVLAGAGPLKVLRFPNFRRGDWFGPACRPEDEAAMAHDCARLLRAEAGSWNALRLDRVDVAAAWPRALADGGELKLGPRRRTDALPYIEFGEDGYAGWMASRSRNFRSQLTRRRKKLEREHGLSFRLTERPDRLEADMETFFRLHDERWGERGGSTMGTAQSRELMSGFAAAALEQGWLRLWIAEADGEPTAAWYGWRIGERYCYALAGMSHAHEKLASGRVLLAHTIEQAAAEGAAIYDLMWGDEDYKSRLETARRSCETWFLGSGAASSAGLRAAVGGVKALEMLPAGASEPLRKARRKLRGR